jgi:hypothetical protein
MRRLRFAIVLPVVQLVLSIGLLKWGRWQEHHPPGSFDTPYAATPVFACQGIRAPAVLLENFFRTIAPLNKVNEALSDKLHGGYNLSFLLGVIILWYLVGRRVDHRISRSAGAETTVGARVSQVLQVIVGICLLPMGIADIGSGARWNNAVGNMLSGTLFLVWSLVLTTLPGAKLVKPIRRSRPHREEK